MGATLTLNKRFTEGFTSYTTPAPVGTSVPRSPHRITRIKSFGKPVLEQVTSVQAEGQKIQ